jgi:hypothetical protein
MHTHMYMYIHVNMTPRLETGYGNKFSRYAAVNFNIMTCISSLLT